MNKCKCCKNEVSQGQEAYEVCGDGYVVWHERCARAQGVEVITHHFGWSDLTKRWGM